MFKSEYRPLNLYAMKAICIQELMDKIECYSINPIPINEQSKRHKTCKLLYVQR